MGILSLFDGISCGRVALDRLGVKVDSYFASEVDKYAIQIAKKNYPDTIEIGDVRNVTYKNGVLYTENGSYKVPKIDLLLGGSPCQSFTFAGKRQGMCTQDNIKITTLDEYLEYKNKGFVFQGQSYLFWEYMRLLKETNPTYFLLENVKMKSEWETVITTAIGVTPIRLNSNMFSAQNRDRLYWTNLEVKDVKKKDTTVLKDIVDDVFDTEKYALSDTHYKAFLKSYLWKPCALTDKSKPLLATYFKQPPHCPYIPSKVSSSGYRRLSPIECERLQTLPDNYTEGVSNSQRYRCTGNGWTVNVIVHILGEIK